MDIPLLLSGLNEVTPLSDPVRKLFDENHAIPEILTAEDIDVLLGLQSKIEGAKLELQLPPVDINVIAIHAKVIKPFVSQSDDEDDFI